MAKKNLTPTPMVQPAPAMLVSCGSMEHPNIVTAAWCGNVCSRPPRVYVSLTPERYSHGLIAESGEFVLNIPTRALTYAADWCGTHSGRDGNKFEALGLTPAPCTQVSAPQIAECPLTVECRVCRVVPLGSHDMFIADIVAVNAEESLLDEQGRLHAERADIAAYVHGEYFALGESLGKNGFSRKK